MGRFPDVNAGFDEVLLSSEVLHEQWGECTKWVRFYLHFRGKYGHSPAAAASLAPFIEKLASKRQTKAQCTRARKAVDLCRPLLPGAGIGQPASVPSPEDKTEQAIPSQTTLGEAPHRTVAKPAESPATVETPSRPPVLSRRQEANAGWSDVEEKLKAEIMLRHYSPKTLKTYGSWIRRFRGFMFNKPAHELSTGDVKAFLTDMAVNKGYSASAQNQAFNALLFLFRHVLKSELGDLSDTPRAETQQIRANGALKRARERLRRVYPQVEG